MLIDWFTVIAQIINFLILVWLLKRFLYRPILNAIDARENRIAAELAAADAKKAEAEQQYEEFQQKNATFDKEKTERMTQLAVEVKEERARLLDAVRLESEDLRYKLRLALKNEQLSLQDVLSYRAKDEVLAITRKVLSDLAGTTLEARITEIFIHRLRDLNDQEKADIKSAFHAPTQFSGQSISQSHQNPLLVRSAFTLSDEQRVLIEKAIQELLGEAVPIQFMIESELISGIEINFNGQKIAWSITDYLASLTKSVEQLLQSSGSDQSGDQFGNQSSHQTEQP